MRLKYGLPMHARIFGRLIPVRAAVVRAEEALVDNRVQPLTICSGGDGNAHSVRGPFRQAFARPAAPRSAPPSVDFTMSEVAEHLCRPNRTPADTARHRACLDCRDRRTCRRRRASRRWHRPSSSSCRRLRCGRCRDCRRSPTSEADRQRMPKPMELPPTTAMSGFCGSTMIAWM